ncbi:FMN-binding negative transcriptional regulator [Streptomyces sp. NPDC056921]|uniref:FMN-binding negative transcriptional regulator n=1 Tax=Streptomyces sp. NPDC056921 TaxID=3345966 RepID=UPI003639ED59
MHVPPVYEALERRQIRHVMERYPLATLATNGPAVPFATHLPVIFAPHDDVIADELAGASMFGHMNRENSHWSSLFDSMSAKLVFSGPHGYVSPTVYDTVPAAPTWNFVAVHIEGTLCPITSFEETLYVVRSTVAAFERTFGDGWQMEESLDYFRTIGPAVGAFRFEVRSVEAMFKLSQEKDIGTQRRVADRFDVETGCAHELASLMREFTLPVDHDA